MDPEAASVLVVGCFFVVTGLGLAPAGFPLALASVLGAASLEASSGCDETKV